eukprot:CAMPEP_0184643684 /NCGR_PEP_ID=MMETSP0308-20130426/507_1 /TAXON_ID=38269 /ORGANISM="Gloeochaete witrockiana, Strain SAG 46.84" /LENGTH=81 /DNA_ID=CAMNT_0027071763 /DNA_START=94 /DNA_END=339 /DNA_ORIENTATION=+
MEDFGAHYDPDDLPPDTFDKIPTGPPPLIDPRYIILGFVLFIVIGLSGIAWYINSQLEKTRKRKPKRGKKSKDKEPWSIGD